MGRKKWGLVIGGLLIFGLWMVIGIWTDPTPRIAGTVKVYDRNGQLLHESAGQVRSQQPVKLDEIPKNLQQAVVITEDARFWQHQGVDVAAIIRAISQNWRAGEIVSGASTIEQQLARFTVISPQKPAPVTWQRKVRELIMAWRLGQSKSKEQILEDYLNVVHLGRGRYGVEAASQGYFGEDVSHLSLSQSALLAGMIANPSEFDPLNHPDKARQRRDFVLGQMVAKKLIDEEMYHRAIAEPLPQEMHDKSYYMPHAVEMIDRQLDELGIDKNSGVKVFTSLDLGWYRLAQSIAQNQVASLKDQHNITNAAVVVMENQTGKIRVLLGSVDYFNHQIEGENNMATALRQPGSAMKPVTYAAAFQSKIATPATLIEDVPKVYMTHEGKGWLPHNYDGRYRGNVLAREALASSYNLPAVEMLERVGIENFLDLAHKMGITTMQETDRYDLALTLGGGEVSLLELTNLYATFARGGRWSPITFINQITNDQGDILYESKISKPVQVLDAEVAWLITDILSDARARMPTFGEKNLLVVSRPAAVKTGTTTDWHDNWTVGYTPDYTVGVWVGNADNSAMQDLTGVTGAAPIWHQEMEELFKFTPKSEFVKPEGVKEVEICAWDGLLPTAACTERYQEEFIAGTEPKEFTPLTQKPTVVTTGELQIINPKSGAVFAINPPEKNQIVLEAAANPEIRKITWTLDGNELTDKDCAELDKYSCVWTPVLGSHRLWANFYTDDQGWVETPEIEFQVVEQKAGWE